jgi:hypothetical protein
MVIACEVAVYASGAVFSKVAAGVGTVICPGIGIVCGWLVGAVASIFLSYSVDCEELHGDK